MERMHPEDLRAIMAAQLAPLVGDLTDADIRRGMESADALLAELTRTAKPEPAAEDGVREEILTTADGRIFLIKCHRDALKVLRDFAAYAERERIIALLHKGVSAPEGWTGSVAAYDYRAGWLTIHEDFLRARLAPKP